MERSIDVDTKTASVADCVTPGSPPKAPAARTERLLTAPIVPTLLRLAAPNVLNLLAIVGMITFDGIFMGRLGADALAGVSLVFPFVMFMQHAAASGMGGGVSSAIARALGAGQRDRANALAVHALMLAIGVSAVATASMLVCGPAVYRAMGGQGPVLTAALAYSNVVFSGVIAIWALNIVASIVRGTGNMGLPAAVIVGSVLAHVMLSSTLIFGWGPVPALGPAGAGWGLIVSFSTGTAVLLASLRKPTSLVTLALRGASFQWKLFAEILKVGVPGMCNVALTNLSVVVLTGIAGRLGRETAIGYALGARLEYILIPLAFGFGTAIVAMVGTNWGAKQFERARRIAWVGGATVALACGAIGLFVGLFGELWMRLFTEDAGIVRSGASYLAIVGPAYGFYGLGMGLYFATQGLGRVLPTVAANGARFLFSTAAGVAAIVWLDAGATGLFAAIAGGFVLYGILTVWALLAVSAPPAAAQSGIRSRVSPARLSRLQR
jgi:putative MATE family efflux protein